MTKMIAPHDDLQKESKGLVLGQGGYWNVSGGENEEDDRTGP